MGWPTPRPEVKMLIVAVLTIVTWLVVTMLTPAESDATLDSFFRKVRPGGWFWKPVRERNPEVVVDTDLRLSLLAAMFSTGIVYFTLPGIGNLIFRHYDRAAMCGVAAFICTVTVAGLVHRLVNRRPEMHSGPATDHGSSLE
jgi:SSS family solute:Na+ symporter